MLTPCWQDKVGVGAKAGPSPRAGNAGPWLQALAALLRWGEVSRTPGLGVGPAPPRTHVLHGLELPCYPQLDFGAQVGCSREQLLPHGV